MENLKPDIIPSQVTATSPVTPYSRANIVSGLIGLIPGIGSAVLGYVQNKRNLREQERQNALNRSDALRQQVYNSEEMQAVRLRAAGMNPTNYIDAAQAVSTEENNSAPVNDLSLMNQGVLAAGQPLADLPLAKLKGKADYANVKRLQAEAEIAKVNAQFAEQEHTISLLKENQMIKNLEVAYDNAVLDGKGKISENEIKASQAFVQQATERMQIELYEANLKGVHFDNDMKTLEINGKVIELNEILPRQIREMDDKHKLDLSHMSLMRLQAQKLGIDTQMSALQYRKAYELYDSEVASLKAQYNMDEEQAKYTIDVVYQNQVSKWFAKNEKWLKPTLGIGAGVGAGILTGNPLVGVATASSIMGTGGLPFLFNGSKGSASKGFSGKGPARSMLSSVNPPKPSEFSRYGY